MARKSIRAIALQLVLAQLLSFGPINVNLSKHNSHTPTSTISWTTDVKKPTASGEDLKLIEGAGTESPTYLRRDDKTGEYETIKIFDTQNIISQQYGANQRVFDTKFSKLIEDPYIWEEVQKYFPVERYSCLEEAMVRYKKYFWYIYDSGCGYAAAADFVFRLFEGKEQEFYDAFGFPMYKIVNNKIDFNYEVFMLKFFNYYNFTVEHNQLHLERGMAKTVNEFKLYKYIKDNPGISLGKSDIANLTEEEWANARAHEEERNATIHELSEKLANSENKYFNFGIPMDGAFGYLYLFLSIHGVTISSSFESGFNNPKEDQIIGSGGFTITKLYASGNEGDSSSYGDHYMYISEILGDGTIIISSWGNMYKYDNSTAEWTDRIVLKRTN